MVRLKNISKEFVRRGFPSIRAVEGVSMDIGRNEFVSIIGPSGCGKSTLFNIIAGIEKPTTGTVYIDDSDITGLTGFVSYMLQKDLLLPWRTVIDNLILGPELSKVSKPVARQQALELVERYGLKGFEGRFPSALSGGMRQRAALLRTLLFDRNVLLLDEPFGALDALTRSSMQDLLLKIFQEVSRTILFITHDVEEAVFLSDVVYVLTGRPARIKAKVEIALPRPRTEELRTAPEFTDLKHRLLSTLHEEVRS